VHLINATILHLETSLPAQPRVLSVRLSSLGEENRRDPARCLRSDMLMRLSPNLAPNLLSVRRPKVFRAQLPLKRISCGCPRETRLDTGHREKKKRRRNRDRVAAVSTLHEIFAKTKIRRRRGAAGGECCERAERGFHRRRVVTWRGGASHHSPALIPRACLPACLPPPLPGRRGGI